MKDSSKRGSCAWVLRYTAMYMAVALPMIACLLLSGKTFLWGQDAYYQQYTTLDYTARVIRSLLSGNGFPMLEVGLGQGMDSLATLSYYGLTDPFQWIGALFTGRSLEVYYHFLVFLYIYLTGLFFMVLIRKTVLRNEKDHWITALSGIVFATCGYQTIGIIKNPYYASGTIYLALMLIAVERILQNRKWIMMSLITTLMLFANFYLAYQTTLLVIVYIVVRLIACCRQQGVRRSAGSGFILMGSYLLGMMLSMAVLLPVALNFINSGRVDVPAGYTDSLLHYPWAYYLKLAALFCAPYDQAGYWALQSFCPVALFGVLMLLRRDASLDLRAQMERRQLRAGLVFGVVCLCVPLMGKLFNGMGYVTNRWCYGFALIVCMAAAWGLPGLLAAEFNGRKRIAYLSLAWAAMMLAYGMIAHKIRPFTGAGNAVAVKGYSMFTKNLAAIAGGMAVAASSVAVLLLDKMLRFEREKAMRILALLTTFCCLLYSAGYAVDAATSDEFKRTNIEAQMLNQTAAAAAFIDDDSFYRVDSGASMDSHAALLGYNGTSYYWSMIPSWVSEHYTDLELSTLRWIFRLEGLGADSYLDALASVGYCVRKGEDSPAQMPYGYEYADSVIQPDGDTIDIYKNRYALPLGYVFGEIMSETEFAKLTPLEKRQALISCAVLENADVGLPAFEGELRVMPVEWQVVEADGVELSGNELRSCANGTITLQLQGLPDSENYLRFGGTEVVSVSDDTDMLIYSLTEAGTNRMYIIHPEGVFNYNQTGVCMSLGYSENGITEVKLRFRDDAVLRFDEMQFYCLPAAYYRSETEQLRSSGSFDAKVEDDLVCGSIALQNPGVLQVSLPYSAGWTAEVDGEDAQIVRCGGMYMGLRLDAGEHEIVLNYETPGLRIGAWISLAGLVLLCVLWLAGRRKSLNKI